jgi:protein-disulfide isomerase
MEQETQPTLEESTELKTSFSQGTPAQRAGFDKSALLVAGSILLASFVVSAAILSSGKFSFKNASDTPIAVQGDGQPTVDAPQVPTGPVDVSADDDAFLGKKDAPVTLIEFSDFQCPFCRKFAEDTLPQLKKEYVDTGKARLVYRDFPLAFHPGAVPAAQGAECAKEQGKFWELHDIMYAEQAKQGSGTVQFTADDVKKWAVKAGVNAAKFNQCLDSGKYKQEVEKDMADGTAAGVSGTPATFVNGRVIVGAQPFSAFKTIIDEELKKVGK